MRLQRAFTLIELLVVISIIAILSAMLMSAIGLVRSSARQLACAAHLRQFTIAILSYTNDNEDFVPVGEWQPLAQAYLDDGGFAAGFKIARCPEAPALTWGGARITNTYAYTGVYWKSWAVGPIFDDPEQLVVAWPFWLFSPYRISLAPMRRPAEKCLLNERWDNTTALESDVSYGVNILNDQMTNLVHGNGSNFAFADGHVQRIPVPGIKRYASVQWAADPMWRPYNSQPSAYVR